MKKKENVFVVCYIAKWKFMGITITTDCDSVTFNFEGSMEYNKIKDRLEEFLSVHYKGKPDQISITSITDVTGKIY